MFPVSCTCGATLTVRASSAGVSSKCVNCGRKLTVPALSVLRSHAEQGVPSPATDPLHTDRVEKSNVTVDTPEKIFAHFCGEVSPTGRVSSSAMNNYVGLVQNKLDSFMERVDRSQGFEMLVSCALLPEDKRIVQVETVPSAAGTGWAMALETLIRNTVAPPIHEGPVAFLLYNRVNIASEAAVGVVPFSALHEPIEELGVDAAMMKAAGLGPSTVGGAKRKSSWWQVLRRILGGSTTPSPISEDDLAREYHQKMNDWLGKLDAYFANFSISQIQELMLQEPEAMGYHVGLAVKFAETEDWSNAIAVYSTVILTELGCAPLYSRRGQLYQAAGNTPAALADFNQAIELASFDPWYYFQRSQIYAALGAWLQAEQDLTRAHQLAPRDPWFLFCRAGIRMEQDLLDQALEDLHETLRLDPNCGQAHSQLGWIHQQSNHFDTRQVIQHTSRAIELMPADFASRIHRSIAYAEENKFALALEDCDAVIQADPDSAPAHGIRGRVLQMEGEFEEAIEACTRAIDLGLETSMVWLTRGISYAATGQTEHAVADCDTALALDPNNALACQLRGTLSAQCGNFDAAMGAFKKAIELAPEWTAPREHLAWLHRLQEHPLAAVDEQSILVAQQPRNASHYINRAFAYVQLHDYQKAESDYDHACELEPENEHIVYFRGIFWMQRQEFDVALRDFNQVLSLADHHDNARLQRATVLLHLKRHSEALDDYAKLIAKHPDDPQAYAGRAYALQMIGEEAAAAADFRRLLRIAPENSNQTTIQSLVAKAHGLQVREQYQEAFAVAEELIAMEPEATMGYRLRASLHWDLEQFVEACEDYTRVLEIGPAQPDVLCGRGQVQAEMGEWLPALDDLDVAIELSRAAGSHLTLAFALSGRALALAGLGRMAESTRDYDESISLCPTNPWVYFHRGMVMYQRGQHRDAKHLLELALQLEEPPLSSRKNQKARTVLQRVAKSDQDLRSMTEGVV